jgi:hypothetical protein
MNSAEITANEIDADSCPASAGLACTDFVWLTPGRFALLLAALVFCTFPAVLLGKQTFVFRDFGLFSFPVAHYFRECFWRGELPLWNPYNYCGVPFLAQWNTMVLYPGSLIYLLLPLTWSLPFFCLLHLFWGGVGMYFCAHNWTRHRLAAAIAGVIFSFNGLSLNFLMWPSHIATFSWVPWVLWLVPLGWQTGGRKLLLGVLVASMQMLAGGPETIFFTWLILSLLMLGECVFVRTEESGTPLDEIRTFRVRTLLRFLATALLVFLICAPQLLPFLQLLSHSERDSGYSSLGWDWSMPLWGGANLLVPMFRTVPDSHGVFFQIEQNWTSSYYAGIGTVLLTLVAACVSRTWRAKLLIGLVLAALVLSLGKAGLVYAWLQAIFPGLGALRYPVKFTILLLSVLPLLAATGLSQMTQLSFQRSKLVPGCLGVIVLLIAGILVFDRMHPLPQDAWHLAWKSGATRVGFLLVVGLLTIRLGNMAGRKRVLGALLLVLVTWLDLLTHTPNPNPTAPSAVLEPGWARQQLDWKLETSGGMPSRAMLSPEADEALRMHSLPNLEQDFLVKRLSLFADVNLLDRIPQTFGFFSLAPKQIADLANLPYVQTNVSMPRLLDFMSVSKTTVAGSLYNWTNRPTAFPIILAGQAPIFGNDDQALAYLFRTNIDLSKTVFLPMKARAAISGEEGVAARVLRTSFRAREITAQIEAPSPALVTIAQTYFPPWRAYVDGRPVRIWRANYAFQAVEIPAGRHELRFVYTDRALAAGAVLFLLGSLGCAALMLCNIKHGSQAS